MISLTGVKHVSFDLWLTLIKSHSAFKRERSNLLKRYFHVQQDEEDVFNTVTRFDRLFNTINETTGGNAETSAIVLVILDALGVQTQTITRQQLDGFYAEMEEQFFKYPPLLLHNEIPGCLQHLQRSGITISLLSNTAFIKGATLRTYLEHAGLAGYFHFQLYSDELGYSKPNPRVFEALYAEAQAIRSLKKNELLHIGDNATADYEGALGAGLQALLVKNDGSDWPELFRETG